MNFSSQILKENASSIDNKFNNVFESRDSDNDSYLYGLLEFNYQLQSISLEERINYYRSLKEASLNETSLIVLQEGVLSGIANFISNIFKSIINAIKRFCDFIRGKGHKSSSSSSSANNNQNNNSKEFEKKKMELLDMEIEVQIFHYPKPDEITDSYINNSITNLTGLLDGIIKSNTHSISGDVSDKNLKICYTTLAKAFSKKYSSELPSNSDEFKSYMKKIVYTTTEKMTPRNYLDMAFKQWVTDKDIHLYSDKLKLLQDTLKLKQIEFDKMIANNKTLNISEEEVEKARRIMGYMSEVCLSAIHGIDACCTMNNKLSKYIVKINNDLTMRARKESEETKHESSMMHGEIFNGDTLFDNEDLRDFNPTEWLDLQLTTECYEIHSQLMESRRSIAVNEAIILSNPSIDTYRRLVTMREAEGEKLGNKMNDIMSRIRQILDQFFSKLKDTISINVQYMKKYKDLIDKPFQLSSVKSKGNILFGLEKLNDNIKLVPFNYENMKEYLIDKKTFFKKYILESMKDPSTKRNLIWDDNMTITEYCKIYFGGSASEDQYNLCEYKSSDLENSRTKIINFLTTPNVIISNTRAELAKLEIEAKKIASEVSKPTASVKQLGSETNEKPIEGSKQTTQNASYYSDLYSTWFTEADIKMDNTAKASESNESGNTNDKNNGFKVYIDAYKDVLLSKITAAEFVRSELMQIVRAHVESYMTKEQKAAENNQNKTNDNNQNKPESK